MRLAPYILWVVAIGAVFLMWPSISKANNRVSRAVQVGLGDLIIDEENLIIKYNGDEYALRAHKAYSDANTEDHIAEAFSGAGDTVLQGRKVAFECSVAFSLHGAISQLGTLGGIPSGHSEVACVSIHYAGSWPIILPNAVLQEIREHQFSEKSDRLGLKPSILILAETRNYANFSWIIKYRVDAWAPVGRPVNYDSITKNLTDYLEFGVSIISSAR